MKTFDGLNLFTQDFIVPEAKANLILVHGLGEHSGRYSHVISAINFIKVNVYIFDLRGHGKSEGEQVYIKSFDEYRQDLEKIYQSVPKDKPLFILGHSLGGLIVTDFLLYRERTEIAGVVLSGSALEIGEDITPFTLKLISILGKLTPKLKTVKLDPNSLSRDKAVVKAYIDDPLVYTGGTRAGIGLNMLNTLIENKQKFSLFEYPVLIMHGEKDKLTNPEGSKKLYKEAKSKDKTLKIWEGAYHEIFNEINKDEVIKYTCNWLEKHL